jgi:3-methylcrotonyl-CoA carboxylase alpha subunit
MFGKILVANRGEIACRVMLTAKRLGIATVAVYSEADSHARHVDLADEAFPIGGSPARESYLVIERILDAAKKSGAEAIHPGYGFLSENAAFAEACAAEKIVFVGPPASAIRAMGSKAAAKALMERSGVPLVPGYHGEAQDFSTIREAAESIGYPVLLKASAGGGGKGMRVVERAADLEVALAGARREALASFGDDRMLVEKYLSRPRHIEIQVFGDAHGNIVSLFERDCSIQRRHQKVVEEAPAPGMEPSRRRAMGEAACAAARAVGYVGAGTVEFIAEGDSFYFMEMNTRLQVEHPVTEMITGQDLVAWQFRVAAGERLPKSRDELGIDGHAIEVRVYAEDPARDFLPSIGTLAHLRQPDASADVRVDTGVRPGDSITPYYDPMIAKLIVHGPTRAAAVRRLREALGEYEVVGVATNLGLLRAIAAHESFAAGDLDTRFIARHADQLLVPRPASAAELEMVWAAGAARVLADERSALAESVSAADPWSPWGIADAWRMNGDGFQELVFRAGDESVTLRVHPRGDTRFSLATPTGTLDVEAVDDGPGSSLSLRVGGVARRVRVVRRGSELTVFAGGVGRVVHVVDPLDPPARAAGGDDRLTAPIPARVARVLVAAGDAVRKGAALVVLEAMKMELTLSAPRDGIVGVVRHQTGEMVSEGTELITFVDGETPPDATGYSDRP